MDMLEILHTAANHLPDRERWELLQALDHIADGESPEQAFRLSKASRRRIRDRALAEAAEAIGETETPWQTAQLLEKAIRRFECRIWPRIRHQDNPGLPPADAALLRAFRTGLEPIRSARRLWELLQ